MTYDAVPEELKERDQWVTWKYVPDRRHPDKPKKLPFNPRTGKPADSTNAQTWGSFALAERAAADRRHTGIGYVFTDQDETFGGDLDDCVVEGRLAAWAEHIIAEMNTYTEISPSGCGVKFFGIGALPENIKRFGDKIPESIKPADEPGGIELYSTGRFFTVTGQHVIGTPQRLRHVNGALARLVAALAPQEPVERATDTRAAPRVFTAGDEYLRQWAERVIERAEETLRLAPAGGLHDTRIDMARLCGGLIPHGLATSDALAERLYAARVPSAHHTTERKAIRDGLTMGEQKALELPPPPPQPDIDSEGYAVCPVHHTRLPLAKNGNGYKCHERDTTTASGWCDFWWKGDGYIPPRAAAEPVIIAGELIATASEVAAMSVPRYLLYKISGLRALPPISWLIDREIPADLTTIVCGASGAGKSFLMIDYAMQIARRYLDRAVVYIAPEGGSGYRARVDAWLNHFGGDEPNNLFFILQAIPLLNPQAVNDFITTIRPLNPVIVIIDTLARCLIGGDENSAKDIGVFFYHTDQIRQETNAAIAVVHHTGKGGAYRGSSSLYGSVESWIDVANDDGLITVSCGKSKDSTPFQPRYLRMVESGESVVLRPSDQVTQRDHALTEGQRKILETLALDIFSEAGARRSELVAATGVNDVTMYRVLSRLKRDRFISQSKKGDPYYITTEGMTAIKNYHRDLRQQRRELSQLSPTINQLSDSPEPPTINYHELSPLKGGDSSSDSLDSGLSGESDESSEDDLFPDEEVTHHTVPITPPIVPAALPSSPPALDWSFLRKAFAARDIDAIKTHCTIRHQDSAMVLEQLEITRE